MTTLSKYPNAGAELHARVTRLMEAKGGTYQQCVHAVLAADPDLEKAYGAPAASARPDEVVHTRAMALIAEDPHLDYHEAMGAVLQADPALKTAYARS